eukprot:366102-Chlamydomonas_euryale.AAC.4
MVSFCATLQGPSRTRESRVPQDSATTSLIPLILPKGSRGNAGVLEAAVYRLDLLERFFWNFLLKRADVMLELFQRRGADDGGCDKPPGGGAGVAVVTQMTIDLSASAGNDSGSCGGGCCGIGKRGTCDNGHGSCGCGSEFGASAIEAAATVLAFAAAAARADILCTLVSVPDSDSLTLTP